MMGATAAAPGRGSLSPAMHDASFEPERRDMIERQLRRRGLHDKKVLDAMFAVPRHEFVPPEYVGAAYDDRPLPIGLVETISQPYVVAAMTAAAQIKPGDCALEVGTGSGYQAAILAYLGARVYTIERNPLLAAQARERLARLGFTAVEVLHGDGSNGHAAAAPYQVILVTAAAPAVPPPLLEQMDEGGRLVIPVGDRYHQFLQLIFKHGGKTATRLLDPVQFVPLVGEQAWPENQ
jgi:protein-L-isoaspartate(D-aspartate) O-methyltransferase